MESPSNRSAWGSGSVLSANCAFGRTKLLTQSASIKCPIASPILKTKEWLYSFRHILGSSLRIKRNYFDKLKRCWQAWLSKSWDYAKRFNCIYTPLAKRLWLKRTDYIAANLASIHKLLPSLARQLLCWQGERTFSSLLMQRVLDCKSKHGTGMASSGALWDSEVLLIHWLWGHQEHCLIAKSPNKMCRQPKAVLWLSKSNTLKTWSGRLSLLLRLKPTKGV